MTNLEIVLSFAFIVQIYFCLKLCNKNEKVLEKETKEVLKAEKNNNDKREKTNDLIVSFNTFINKHCNKFTIPIEDFIIPSDIRKEWSVMVDMNKLSDALFFINDDIIKAVENNNKLIEKFKWKMPISKTRFWRGVDFKTENGKKTELKIVFLDKNHNRINNNGEFENDEAIAEGAALIKDASNIIILNIKSPRIYNIDWDAKYIVFDYITNIDSITLNK